MPLYQSDSTPYLMNHNGKDATFSQTMLLQKNTWRRVRSRPLVTHAITIAITLGMITFLDFYGISPIKPLWISEAQPLVWTPFTTETEYVIETPPSDYWSNPLYFGPPSDESEMAWNELIDPHGIQILPEEEQHFDMSQFHTVKHKNGNHLLIPSIYHNLHCLRKFRQLYIYPDHYYPNITDEERQHELDHSMHCLETIRTSMICRPDLTLMKYFWSGRRWHDRNVAPDSARECVNWDKIQRFKKSRTYDPMDVMHDGITQGEYEAKHY